MVLRFCGDMPLEGVESTMYFHSTKYYEGVESTMKHGNRETTVSRIGSKFF